MKPFKNLNIKIREELSINDSSSQSVEKQNHPYNFCERSNGLPLHAEDRLSSYPTKVRNPSTPPHKNVTFLAKA